MNAVVESLPNCLATIRVEVEPEKVSAARDKVTREISQAVTIAGYRPGKAPRAIIEKKYKKQIREELEKKLLGDSTYEAIQQHKLRVLQLTNYDDIQFSDDDRLNFTATVVTEPDFQLPNYKGLLIHAPTLDVSDAEVDASLDNLREQGADFVDITEDRGAAMEDYVVVDYTGTIDGKPVHEVFPKAGKPLSGNDEFWIKMTDEAFFPGYCAALVGAKPGESRSFDITVPEDFPVEGMPGQVIHYEVKLTAIKSKILPELNDAFADTVSKGKTLADLRDLARKELESQKRNNSEQSKRHQIVSQLLANVECELPSGLVRNETQRILLDIVRQNEERGVSEDVLKESEKELVGAASENARERIKSTFVLSRIAEQEGIKITKEELFGRIAMLAERYQMPFEKMLKELQKRNAVDQIKEEILTGKTLNFLVSQATVTATPVSLT